jgi:adhesin transport system outer membrane protein
MKKVLGFMLFLAVGFFLLGNAFVAQAETLQDAIQVLIKTNPDIKAAAYNRLARDQEVVQAKSRYYPTLDATGSTGYYNEDHPEADDSWPNEAVLSLRQNVFEGGASLSEVQRQQARVKSQAYLVQATAEKVGLLASRAFFNVLRSMDLVNLAKENLLIHERIYDQVRLRSQAGVDRKADLDQVMGRLALAQANLITAKANFEDARTEYQAVIGNLPEDLVKPESVSATIPGSMDEAEYEAVANYPLLKSAKADVEARQKQHETAKRVLYPTLDVGADYRWQHDTADVNGEGYQEDLSVTATARFNIFNGFKNKGRIDETKLLINEAEEIMNGTQRQVVAAVKLSYEAFLADQGRVKKLEDYVKAAGLTAEAFVAQWNIGRRSLFDVLDTQAEYINAKVDLLRASYDQQISEYRVLSNMGKLCSTVGVAWPDEGKVDAGK